MSIEKTTINSNAQKPRFFSALDGYRGIFCLMVAAYHTAWSGTVTDSAFMQNGAVIIDLFFVLSGFLMFTLYTNKINDRDSFLKFMKKRFARLYPIHFFMLAVFLAFGLFRVAVHSLGFGEHAAGEVLPFQPGSSDGWGSLFSNIFLLQAMGLHDQLSFNPPSWSISTEFWAYAVFGLLVMFIKPKKHIHFYYMAVLVIALYSFLAQVKPDMNITYDFAFIRCMAGFFLGGVALYTYQMTKSFLQKRSFFTMSVLEFAVCTIGVLFIIYCSGALQFFVAPILLAFVVIHAHDGGVISKIASTKVPSYLAKISLSVYMIHSIFGVTMHIGTRLLMPYVLGPDWESIPQIGNAIIAFYLCVVVFASHFTYKYVELAGAKWVNSLEIKKTLKRVSGMQPSL